MISPLCDLIDAALEQLGVYTGAPSRRHALVEDIVRDGFTADHLGALFAKCEGAKEPGGRAVHILVKCDWHAELGQAVAKAKADADAPRKETWSERSAREHAANLAERARTNMRTVEQQTEAERRGYMWEQLRAIASAQQIAERLGISAAFLASELEEHAKERGYDLSPLRERLAFDPTRAPKIEGRIRAEKREQRAAEERGA